MSDEVHRREPNRLAEQKSPYLLQHAHNPVDWYPWGEEAFEKARREDKPIFLSIGYSTCHWCHVMERESFEDEEIAELLNRDFVPVKVDREERPDIDRVYMTAVQALTGHGGWPLSAFLTPDLEPFYAGTYFPPRSRWGRPGFTEVLAHIRRAWDEKREGVLESAREITAALRRFAEGAPARPGVEVEPETLLRDAASRLIELHDDELGGFGGAPKFPRPTQLLFLLAESRRRDDSKLAEPALHTLREMWRGGIHDHLAGGFHRYSVDAYWRVPHFEKMLYDQAQLIWAYLDAHQLTGEEFYAEAVRDIAEYVLRDLEHGEGGFYSAEDADSAADPARPEDKEEGAFYLWELDEVRDLLAPEQLEVVVHRFGLSDGGNTISDPQGELGTRNVLFAAREPHTIASSLDLDRDRVSNLIEAARSTLLEQRETRPRPHLDDKILTAWNGLMISALARAGAVLDEPRYREAAERAARFVLEHNRDEDGALVRRFRDGEAGQPAQLDDHAFLALGLLDLYDATFEPRWLAASLELTETAIELFGDGGALFYDSDGEDPTVLVRSRTLVDGAEPAGTSAMVHLLLRLGWALARPRLRELGESAFHAALRDSQTDPSSAPWLLAAAGMVLTPPTQVIFRGRHDSDSGRALTRAVHGPFAPGRVLLWLEPETEALLEQEGPELPPAEGNEEALAYLCHDLRCELPTADPARLRARLAGSD